MGVEDRAGEMLMGGLVTVAAGLLAAPPEEVATAPVLDNAGL